MKERLLKFFESLLYPRVFMKVWCCCTIIFTLIAYITNFQESAKMALSAIAYFIIVFGYAILAGFIATFIFYTLLICFILIFVAITTRER